jgi:hypothetical protein
MTLGEFLAALDRLGDGDWQIVDVRSAEEVEGSGRPEVGAAVPEGRQGPTTTPLRRRRRLRKKKRTNWL